MIRALNVVLRFVLGAIFVFAGAEKIFNPVTFATNIANFRLLPQDLVNLLAITLPWLELLTGLMLVLGLWVRASALVVGGMCVVFLVAITQALARGLDIRCGCFGTVEAGTIGLRNLALDLGCLLVAAWLVWQERGTVSRFQAKVPRS